MRGNSLQKQPLSLLFLSDKFSELERALLWLNVGRQRWPHISILSGRLFGHSHHQQRPFYRDQGLLQDDKQNSQWLPCER